jgi:hypothetical protein
MTFVGKILVFVQLALSVLFMAFAGAVYSVHHTWRDANQKSQDQVKQLQTDLQAREQQFASLQKESETRLQAETQRAEAAEASVQALTAQVAELGNRVASLTTERNQLQTSADVAQKEALARREEAMKVRDLNRTLHAKLAESLDKVRNLEDQVYNKDLTIAQMDSKHKGILGEMAQLERIIKLNDLETDPSVYEALQDPPPNITGVVLAKRAGETGRSDLIEVSLGSDDGLSRGHDLYVYRNHGEGKYLGRINIVYVTPDRAVGALLEKSRNGVIQEGDHVTSKL